MGDDPRRDRRTAAPNTFQAQAVADRSLFRVPGVEDAGGGDEDQAVEPAGLAVTASTAMKPPIELPTTVAPSIPSFSQKSCSSRP